MKMEVKLKRISKMKRISLLALFLILPLASCSKSDEPAFEKKVFCFDSMMEIKLYEGTEEDVNKIEEIFLRFDKLSDNYQARDITNVYTLNQTNDPVLVSSDLYDLLMVSSLASVKDAKYFNPLCGSLSKLWKESLKNQQIPSESAISNEVNKIKTSSISLKNDNYVQRIGEAEIDLGAIAKGYALDEVKKYLDSKNIGKYLINGGYSSILLGEKNSEDGYFSVGIKDLDKYSLNLKKCFVSTSGVSEQGVKVGETTYSHIVNPYTGSAINNYDSVVVISDCGYLGDAISTSLMMSSIDEIKQVETSCGVKVIAIKDNAIVYKSE